MKRLDDITAPVLANHTVMFADFDRCEALTVHHLIQVLGELLGS